MYEIMNTEYIYLLIEREFINAKQSIFKVGKTTQSNNKRIKQYPKGSMLLYQSICQNCGNIEKQIIKKFKEEFKQRKDIGTEYFEGDYKIMIDIIYLIIKQECLKEVKKDDQTTLQITKEEEEEEEEEECQKYLITTFEEWIKCNEISEIIITNKKKMTGYLRFAGQLYRVLYDINSFDYDANCMEDLESFIKYLHPFYWQMVTPRNELVSRNEMSNLAYDYKNELTNKIITRDEYNKLDKDKELYKSIKNNTYKFIKVEYDDNKILQDTLNKCYKKTVEHYNLEYHEYIVNINNSQSSRSSTHFILNTLLFTITSVDKVCNNKILTHKYLGHRIFCFENGINICMVDAILDSLIHFETKQQYKTLVYNLIVKQENPQIIFYDYNKCLLTTWITSLLYSISGKNICVYSNTYYEDKIEFNKLLKTNEPRCVIIRYLEKITIEKQIKDFCKLGFKNIIVCQKDKTNDMYNIINFKKYLQDNKEEIVKCLKEEYGHKEIPNIRYDDEIFYMQQLFLTNFLKWCCFI